LADGTWIARWQIFVPLSREIFALAVFLAAAATDLLDGYLARRWGQVTTVGTLLDPIADKLLVSAALVSLVDIHRVPAWIVILIIGREFAVSGLRSIASASGYTIAASELGKTKMAAQVAAISFVIAGIRWPELQELGIIAMWAVMIFGIASAADYFRKFWRRVDDQVKQRRRRELLRLERQKKRAERARMAEAPLASRDRG
jgi:CDP-diacylglycerol--glycerol-3-phosphate 3-phosphatidyltransferase